MRTDNAGTLADIQFYADNANNAKIQYAEIEVEVDDTTAGGEDGDLNIKLVNNGTLTSIFDMNFASGAARMGFFGVTAVGKPTVTGSRGGNAALASLLSGLQNLGLITDSTTA